MMGRLFEIAVEHETSKPEVDGKNLANPICFLLTLFTCPGHDG